MGPLPAVADLPAMAHLVVRTRAIHVTSRPGQCRALGLSLLSALLWACAPAHDWTAEEIGNAEHVWEALGADQRAAEIENLGEAGPDDAGEAEAALEHRERALREAQSVRDDVLAKAHPDLQLHFRNEFQRSMELFVKAARLRESDFETEAIRLRKRFGDWYRRHGEEIRVPRL